MRRIAIALSVCLLLCGLALADQLTKNDGTIITGEVIAQDAESVTIKCSLGEVKVPRSEIKTLSIDPKGYDPRKPIEELAAETITKLRVIAVECDKNNCDWGSTRVNGLVNEVLGWRLKVVPPKALTAKGKAVDLAVLLKKLQAVNVEARGRKITQAQADKQLEALESEFNEHPTKQSLYVALMNKGGAGNMPTMVLQGTIGKQVVEGMTLHVVFKDAADFPALEKLNPGDTVTVSGIVIMNKPYGVMIEDARIAK